MSLLNGGVRAPERGESRPSCDAGSRPSTLHVLPGGLFADTKPSTTSSIQPQLGAPLRRVSSRGPLLEIG